MIHFEHRVGRLFECRAEGHLTAEDMKSFRQAFIAALMKLGKKCIIVADLRGTTATDEDARAMLLGLVKVDNPSVERSAWLMSRSADPTFVAEMERLIQEGGLAGRRSLRDAASVSAWLASVVTPAEAARLAEFLRGA